ncbi:hypothetical protein [Aquipuribacter hungaricus]|uniref:Uncharacterized protein n=1 Tax=Aquipuribacter hungaricus TaxID=545624 RepID=A0ABV7WEV8_9MICO
MRRTTLAAVSSVLLVVGVLAVRGGSAAGQEDLRPLVRPSQEPSLQQSQEPPPGVQPVVLEPDGLPWARLGSDGAGLATAGDRGLAVEGQPGGCVPAWSPTVDASGHPWESTVRLLGGEVVSVVLGRPDPTSAALPGLRTWLGPTLGSPLSEAAALPGARTSTARPAGTDGPVVTTVLVPGAGAGAPEVVLSDSPRGRAHEGEEPGRTTRIEVRLPAGRACSTDAPAPPSPPAGGTEPPGPR